MAVTALQRGSGLDITLVGFALGLGILLTVRVLLSSRGAWWICGKVALRYRIKILDGCSHHFVTKDRVVYICVSKCAASFLRLAMLSRVGYCSVDHHVQNGLVVLCPLDKTCFHHLGPTRFFDRRYLYEYWLLFTCMVLSTTVSMPLKVGCIDFRSCILSGDTVLVRLISELRLFFRSYRLLIS